MSAESSLTTQWLGQIPSPIREPRQKLTLHPAPVGSLQAGDDAQQGELRRQEIEEHVDRGKLRIVCRLSIPGGSQGIGAAIEAPRQHREHLDTTRDPVDRSSPSTASCRPRTEGQGKQVDPHCLEGPGKGDQLFDVSLVGLPDHAIQLEPGVSSRAAIRGQRHRGGGGTRDNVDPHCLSRLILAQLEPDSNACGTTLGHRVGRLPDESRCRRCRRPSTTRTGDRPASRPGRPHVRDSASRPK